MKKTFKPLFTVDLTECETPRDIYVKYADAKVAAGLPITKTEYDAVIAGAEDNASLKVTMVVAECEPKKKPNVFKRFWNWLTRKNK